jgi:hypothetical protein
MEAMEKRAHGSGFGQGKAQTAFQTIIARQQRHILGTIPTGGLEQDDAFDVLGVGATALALLEFKVGGDQVGNFQGPQGARGGQQAGVSAGHFVQRTRVDFEGRLMLSWYARRHGRYIDILSI